MTALAIFLETSVQTHRIVAERTVQEALETQLRSLSPHFYTHHYVWEESAGDWKFALYFIEQALQIDLRERFWTHVAPLADPIAYDLVALGSQRQADDTFAVAALVAKPAPPVGCLNFLPHNARNCWLLRIIWLLIRASSNNRRKQNRSSRLCYTIPRAALGQSACWPLGDLIIALQIPPNTTLWTRDPDFAPLAAALDIPLYQPPVIE